MPRDMNEIMHQEIEREIVEQLENQLCVVLVQIFYDLFLCPMVALRMLVGNG